MTRLKLFWVGVIVFLLFAGLAGASLFSTRPTSKIDVLVAPQGSTLKLDGKGIKSGVRAVRAGTHLVAITKSGFETQTKSVIVREKGTTFVGIILQPNTPETQNWYATHPEDSSLAQTINNRLFDEAGSQVTTPQSLLKNLPYVGPGLSFRIDYGVPSQNAKKGQLGIYIRYRTDQDKQAASDWLKTQVSDINSLDIIYIKGNF